MWIFLCICQLKNYNIWRAKQITTKISFLYSHVFTSAHESNYVDKNKIKAYFVRNSRERIPKIIRYDIPNSKMWNKIFSQRKRHERNLAQVKFKFNCKREETSVTDHRRVFELLRSRVRSDFTAAVNWDVPIVRAWLIPRPIGTVDPRSGKDSAALITQTP